MEIHAYAGPMNKEGAERFRKMMKTPPRILNFGSPLRTPATIASLKLKDHEKGLERLGNNLARKMDVPWKEYWPFLDSFVDLASEDGLRQFENYLAEKMAAKYNCDTPSPTTSATPPSRHSGVGKLPCFTEHTSLADQMASNRSAECSPLTELCRALQACKLNDNSYYSPNNNHKHTDLLCIRPGPPSTYTLRKHTNFIVSVKIIVCSLRYAMHCRQIPIFHFN